MTGLAMFLIYDSFTEVRKHLPICFSVQASDTLLLRVLFALILPILPGDEISPVSSSMAVAFTIFSVGNPQFLDCFHCS